MDGKTNPGSEWLSRDPLPDAERSQGANLYDYVINNPISRTDDLGLCCVSSLDLLTSGKMQGGKKITDYFPSLPKLYPGYGPSDPSQLGPFSFDIFHGAAVQIIAKTTGSGTCSFKQSVRRGGEKSFSPDTGGGDQNSQPFMQPIDGGQSYADVPGIQPNGATFKTCVSSTPSKGECCKYSVCCVAWHEDKSGQIYIISKNCQ